MNDFLHEVLHFQSFNHVIHEQNMNQKTYINIWLWKMNKHFHAVKVKFRFLKIKTFEVPTMSLLTDSWCFGILSPVGKRVFLTKWHRLPLTPFYLKRHNLYPPTWKCSNSFQFCWCHCHWLSIRHRVIKEWMRNCVGSAVALIALSEPSGRFFIKGGYKEERGDGWRCSPDKSACTGNHCLVQPGSTNALQFRVGTWQVPMSYRAACTRPQTSLFPRLILYGCTCQGLFVHPWSPLPHSKYHIVFQHAKLFSHDF